MERAPLEGNGSQVKCKPRHNLGNSGVQEYLQKDLPGFEAPSPQKPHYPTKRTRFVATKAAHGRYLGLGEVCEVEWFVIIGDSLLVKS